MSEVREPRNDREYLAALCRAVPFHVVQAVLENPTEAAVQARRVEGSVLVADLVGFTTLCERMGRSGPEALSRLSQLLDQVFSHLEHEALFPHRGYLIEFGGDAITAIFTGEDHARRCAAAALLAPETLRRAHDALSDPDIGALALRVGAASGGLILTVLGDINRRLSVCLGVPLQNAIIAQQNAEPGEVAIDVSLARALEGCGAQIHQGSRALILSSLSDAPAPNRIPSLSPLYETQTAEKIALLEPFVAAPLAKRLRKLPGGWRIDPEIRTATILFVEADGFATSGISPRRSSQLMRSVMRALLKFDGLVLKINATDRGHRLMAVFGLHSPSEHDAEKAVLAGLEVISRFRGFTDPRKGAPDIKVGIHTGQFLFGAIGSDAKHDLTAIGDAVNVTARVASVAESYEVLVTEQVQQAIRADFDTEARGEVTVKGREAPLRLHVVQRPATNRARNARQRTADRPVIGRAEAMARLDAGAKRAFGGTGTVIGLRGEAGSGKSHLLARLIDTWCADGGRAVVTRCRFSARGAPLSPVRDLMSAVIGATPEEDDAQRTQKLREYLSRFDLELASTELLALFEPVRRPDGFDEAILDMADLNARERLVGTMVRLLDRRLELEGTPMMYVFEDMHHADSLTLELSLRMADMPLGRPVLLVGTWRPDPLLRTLERLVDEVVDVGPLSLEETGQLVQIQLKAQSVEPTLLELLHQRSGGNPERVLQTVAHMTQKGMLAEREGTLVIQAASQGRLEEAMSPGWEHVALARLDGLSELQRRVLRTGSAIGSTFDERLIVEISAENVTQAQIFEALATLERLRIVATELSTPRSWKFRDEVIRSAAYATLPPDERAAVHRRIADALERAGTRDFEGQAAIGLHRERAGQGKEAVKWLARAGRAAFRGGFEIEAQRICERWLELTERLDATGARAEDVTSIAVIRAYLLGARGKPGEALEAALDILRTRRSALEPDARALLQMTIARSRDAMGQLKRARIALRRATSSSVETVAFEARLALAQISEWLGDFEDGRFWLAAASAHAQGHAGKSLRVSVTQAWLQLATRDLLGARLTLEGVGNTAKALSHPRLRAAAVSGLGFVELLEGNFEEAQQQFELAVRLARGLNNVREEASALVRSGAAHLLLGRPTEALEVLELARSLLTSGEHLRIELELGIHRGAALVALGRLQEGSELFESAWNNARTLGLWLPDAMARLHRERLPALQRIDDGKPIRAAS